MSSLHVQPRYEFSSRRRKELSCKVYRQILRIANSQTIVFAFKLYRLRVVYVTINSQRIG